MRDRENGKDFAGWLRGRLAERALRKAGTIPWLAAVIFWLAAVMSLGFLNMAGYAADRERQWENPQAAGQTENPRAAGQTETEQRDEQSRILDQLNLEEIERYIRQQGAETEVPGLRETMEMLMEGRGRELAETMMKAAWDSFFGEIAAGGRIVGQILLLGILAAVFGNFSSVFRSSQISETGFFVTYLLLFALLTAGLAVSMSAAADTVAAILGFMKVLMPAYFLAVAFSGATVSAIAMYETTVAVMAAGQWLLHTVLLPLVRVYLVLTMAGNMMKDNLFSKLTEILKQVIVWGLRTLLGVVAGIQLLQTLVLPYVDSLKNGSLQKLAGMIPGIGQGMSAVTQMILGSGVLIRNTMGMAAVLILLALLAAPALKLLALMLLYQCAAALMEPVCDKRILACVSAAAEGHRLLLKIVMTAAFLLILTVAVVCAGANAVYYA